MAQKAKRVTQSYRLYLLFSRKHNVSTKQMAKVMHLKPEYVGSYLAEMKRVYGAKIKYNADKKTYRLENKITVPPGGLAGRKKVEVVRKRRRKQTARPRHRAPATSSQVAAPAAT